MDGLVEGSIANHSSREWLATSGPSVGHVCVGRLIGTF